MIRSLFPAAAATALAVVACSPTVPRAGLEATAAPASFGHVHGVEMNPADGSFWAATHYGVFELTADCPVRIADRYQDTMGFTISGPDVFLGSGHPDPRDGDPPHLGFIRSTDRAANWSTLSLRGEADFHALSAVGRTIYGVDATDGLVMRSDDSGTSWQAGASLAVTDLDVDPASARHVVAATPDGLPEDVDGPRRLLPARPSTAATAGPDQPRRP